LIEFNPKAAAWGCTLSLRLQRGTRVVSGTDCSQIVPPAIDPEFEGGTQNRITRSLVGGTNVFPANSDEQRLQKSTVDG